MYKLNYIWILLTGLFISGCSKDPIPESIDLGFDYFPTEIGRYNVYQVDSISYNDFFTPVKIDTTHFQIMELLESNFKDNEGRECQRIERYIRASQNSAWVLRNVFYQVRTAVQAERIEDNVRFVRLIFPIQENQKWNGNAYNSFEKSNYQYKEVDQKKMVKGKNFDSTLVVNQKLDSNLIEKNYQVEIYAKHVGLIFKKYIDVQDKSSSILPLPFSQRIDAGFDYTYQLIESGKK